VPANCTPSHQTLFIPNVTTDVGLSPPYNSLFTFFGQFFDHGVDQTVKSGGTVFVPLKADDPLIAGPDHVFGTADDLPPQLQFMVLTRGQNQPGPDGVLGTADDIQNANNTDTPWVDQSQTYTSHPSHQVFLREYVNNSLGKPVSTGKLLGGLPAGQTYAGSPDGTHGIGTWAAVKKQAHDLLGLQLVDMDVLNVPMLATDPYGKFIPGPLRGLPQYVTSTGLVEGNIASPVPVPANVLHMDTPFLTDIAHNADPSPQDTDNNPSTPPVAPVPDSDNTPSADFANQAPGTYDDEMLNAHFSCGDGRCNENIALSTIHQVFHSEHDRLVDDIKNTLSNDTSPTGVAALAEWKLSTGDPNGGWNGERLFQAARFVTEMEYQHLVFEEFARKVQPAVRPFHVYSPDINPAIKAEFAHAVYRFGHSMLDEDIARTNADGTPNNIPLLNGFLNPPAYFDGGTAGTLTPEAAAGSIVMGSADQTGNELDEFVTDTLRNNLLGLPLDLPTLNLTRAREAGVPPLNDVRRQIFAQTNDGQLAPYTSWSDFGQHLKHPESLINFVAAYGTHPSITSQSTLAGKRAAARAIVNPLATDVPPADAADFMFSNGAWVSPASGVTTTGLDSVDLWVGGLAEITNLFGGLLGSTFNYVFETQLESLQDGDRLYYLARTPGMNLRSQLEANSFSELIQRNTDNTNSLKADAFATADCKFQLGNITSPYSGGVTLSQTANPPLAPLTGVGSVNDDPKTTDCDENQLLLKQPNGTVQYRQFNNIDPSGINGQSVYQGTDGVDKMFGGNDNDTFWGGKGNDIIEGNGGDDVALGGEGNDIITDLSGADVLKGGPGNDAIDGGIGNDILAGGDGSDFINGGANDNETFGGDGNDFIIAGQGADTVFGDGGDDWIQGGTGQDLLQGDHGAPFFDDPAQVAPGNDIFIGQPGENDYDAEGGDDIMAQNAAIDRNAGAAGFDWAIHQYDTVGADDDMNINNNLLGKPLPVVVNRDRWQETEADSGSAFDDLIKGQDTAPDTVGGGGFTGCDALDQAGLDRISGLGGPTGVVRSFDSTATAVTALSATGYCPLTGPVWGAGDIILGGLGSDTLEGRGANDIIDGDRFLQVRISVRDHTNHNTEIGTTDLMEHQYLKDAAGAPTGQTLQQAVFAGTVDPGDLVATREIITPAVSTPGSAGNNDTAVFSGVSTGYTITTVGDTTTVDSNGGIDGVDTVRNVEHLHFTADNVTIDLVPPAAPTIGTATAGVGSATVNWTPPAGTLTSQTVRVLTAAGVQVGALITVPANATSRVVTGLTNGTSYQFQVSATNAYGTSPYSALSNVVTPAGDTTAPTVTTRTPAAGATDVNVASDVLLTFSEAVTGVSGTTVQLRNASNVLIPAVVTYNAGAHIATLNPNANLAFGTSYTVRVLAGITDIAGNPLAASTVGFQTNFRPAVLSSVPSPNALLVRRGVNVTVTFTEDVLGANATTVRLIRVSNGAAVTAAVTYNAATHTVTLDPTVTLASLVQYRVSLTGGAAAIRDLQNAPLANTTWTFRTGVIV